MIPAAGFRIALSAEAGKALDRLDRPTADRIRARLRQLEADPFEARISKPLVAAEGKWWPVSCTNRWYCAFVTGCSAR